MLRMHIKAISRCCCAPVTCCRERCRIVCAREFARISLRPTARPKQHVGYGARARDRRRPAGCRVRDARRNHSDRRCIRNRFATAPGGSRASQKRICRRSSIFRNSEDSSKVFRDGWFYPGDLGTLNTDGLLVITGREQAVLNLGGDKISPRNDRADPLTVQWGHRSGDIRRSQRIRQQRNLGGDRRPRRARRAGPQAILRCADSAAICANENLCSREPSAQRNGQARSQPSARLDRQSDRAPIVIRVLPI